jgi:NADH-quinone oxidoreductase subunit L
MTATTLAWLVLAFPLAGTVVCALFGLRPRAFPERAPGWVGTGAIAASFGCAVGCFVSIQSHSPGHRQLVSTLFDYVRTAGVDARLTILVDPLSVLMMLVVSGVSALIHLYSVAYMSSDRGYARFFSYLNFFVFAMLLLVLGGNFIVLIVGWAFVGAASYLLISFWYRRATATAAGIKAFVITWWATPAWCWAPTSSSSTPGRSTSSRPSPRSITSSPRTRATWWRGASCCCWARLRNRRRSRCTHGSPTPWRGPLR